MCHWVFFYYYLFLIEMHVNAALDKGTDFLHHIQQWPFILKAKVTIEVKLP